MDIAGDITTLIEGLDWALIAKITIAFVAFILVLRLKRFGEQTAYWFALKSANFIRVGDTVAIPNAVGSEDGKIVAAGLKRVKVDMGRTIKYIPTKSFVDGTITVVKNAND